MSLQWKKFKSPNSFVRRVALLTGHIYEVGQDFIDLPDFAWTEAYRVGCVSEDMSINANIPTTLLKALSDEADEMDVIKDILLTAIEESTQDAFKKNGEPNMLWLQNKVGHRVEKHIVDKIWFRIQNGE